MIDSVRASRDGHEFHEAWTARRALQLLLPSDDLHAIAVEGLSSPDNQRAAAASVEIADLTLYYGHFHTFETAKRVVILQFKYSIRDERVVFRMSDAKKTIQKFAAAYTDHKTRFGVEPVERKLEFTLVTNRPLYGAFESAVQAIARGQALKGEAEKQAKQFERACGFKATELRDFAKKISVTGLTRNLSDSKRDLSTTLVDWSAASDTIAGARLNKIKQLVRDKAGSAGQRNNVIKRIDVIGALGLQGIEDLLPCPEAFPSIGKVVPRNQLNEVAELIPKVQKPLLIHAAGGIGKTVFLQSLAKLLAKQHQTVLFDCFGGGRYRAPDDSRHLPKRGLTHIVNTLACRGLCDPLLPTNADVQDLIRAARRRLAQAVSTLKRDSVKAQLLIFIDAIDNSAVHAKDNNEPSFPKLLLESFHYTGRVEGVQLIVSCRTHRRDVSRGEIPCEEVELRPFDEQETSEYLHSRVKNLSVTEEKVAFARSNGNPRILEHLVRSDRGLLDVSEIDQKIELNDLLRARIQNSLQWARDHGYKEAEIKAFLAGLAVLPPPVPPQEYADTYRTDLSAIESFAADLAPLLERTSHGLMFRDEPTETLIRESYASDVSALRAVAQNLFNRQGESLYAASALPSLLNTLDDGELLFKLAFDERFPRRVTSTVGKQSIRYARLKAAALHSATKGDYNRLVHLLVELSTIAASNERGTNYILENPDLVVAFQEEHALRRLFETRTAWQGTRHARLTIANVLSRQLPDAERHAKMAWEWTLHSINQDEQYRHEKSGPGRQDVAAVPLCLIAQGRAEQAAHVLQVWKPWYVFEACEFLFSFLNQARSQAQAGPDHVEHFLKVLRNEVGIIAAGLSFLRLDARAARRLIRKLSKAIEGGKAIDVDSSFYVEKSRSIQDGLLKASATALAIKSHADALTICSNTPTKWPELWSFDNWHVDSDVFAFVCRRVILDAARNEALTERSILPKDLFDLCLEMPIGLKGEELKVALKKQINERFNEKDDSSKDKKAVTYEFKYEAEGFIDRVLEPLFQLTRCLGSVLSKPIGRADKAFLGLVSTWVQLRKNDSSYGGGRRGQAFFERLGRKLVMFSLWSRHDLSAEAVSEFLARLNEGEFLNATLFIEAVEILATRTELQELAGKTALAARGLIDGENEVGRRAALYARLARAMLPASSEEAASYFRLGLEQLDAVGSGDYQFTYELLLFAASLKNSELDERDFHRLTNICELNIPDEAEKFPWYAFGKGLSRVAGCRGLAKISRWDDRSQVSLDITLLPYLTALIEDDKIEPDLALGLLRLSDPAELWECNTIAMARAIHSKKYPNFKELIAELLRQFHENNPRVSFSDTMRELDSLAKEAFGEDEKESKYLSAASSLFKRVIDEQNENRNYRGKAVSVARIGISWENRKGPKSLSKVAARTPPTDETAISKALAEIQDPESRYDRRAEFLKKLRENVKFSQRVGYIRAIAHLDDLNIHTKLGELAACKELWVASSAQLDEVYESIGIPLLRSHADDIVSNDRLSEFHLREIVNLCRIPKATLTLELVKLFAMPGMHISGAVWMALASEASKRSTIGPAREALERLLRSGATKLASSVADGDWKAGLYPTGSETAIAGGMVWRRLGSPSAADRWRAAHSVRCFARFGNWNVIDVLVSNLASKEAGTFQATDLQFYFLHARLWLLIALARVALDYPGETARYEQPLRNIAFDSLTPHVLARHFAALALIAGAKTGNTQLSETEVKQLETLNVSPFPKLAKTARRILEDPFLPRPSSHPKPSGSDFHFDYDFTKNEIHSLASVFGKTTWEVKDLITEFVRMFDSSVSSMYEKAGRDERSSGRRSGRMSSEYHLYGQQLAWNGLFCAAGRLLERNPVTNDSYRDDPWPEWLSQNLLTRTDGLWLSDGIDVTPLDTLVNLLERNDSDLAITGNRLKLLELVGISSGVPSELVVEGHWLSADGVQVSISSALVSPSNSRAVALQTAKEEPFRVWLPTSQSSSEGEYQRDEKDKHKAWIVVPSTETHLDADDPMGAASAVRRPYFVKEIREDWSLRPADPFNRMWLSPDDSVVARAQAWRSIAKSEDSLSSAGHERLMCSSQFLQEILARRSAELLLLIKLQRYESGIGRQESRFWHTIATIRMKRTLRFELFRGCTNRLHKSSF